MYRKAIFHRKVILSKMYHLHCAGEYLQLSLYVTGSGIKGLELKDILSGDHNTCETLCYCTKGELKGQSAENPRVTEYSSSFLSLTRNKCSCSDKIYIVSVLTNFRSKPQEPWAIFNIFTRFITLKDNCVRKEQGISVRRFHWWICLLCFLGSWRFRLFFLHFCRNRKHFKNIWGRQWN